MAMRLLNTQRIVNLSSNPASGSAGEIYFNTTDGELKVYDGTSWSALGGGGGGASVTISDTAPASPTAGNLWYDSTDGRTYIYYDSTWVEIGTASISPTGNYDGGLYNSNYGGITALDGGAVT